MKACDEFGRVTFEVVVEPTDGMFREQIRFGLQIVFRKLLPLKAHRRKLERIYIQSHSLTDLFKLRSATNKYHKLITSDKRSFNSNLIIKSASNPRLV